MGGLFVGKIDCPRCGGSLSLNMWEEDNKRTGYCFHSSCSNKYFNTQALSEIPESSVIAIEDKEPKDYSWIQELPSRDNPQRGLKRGAYAHFGVKHGVSRQDGQTIAETYYPCRLGIDLTYKVRIHDPKKFYCIGQYSKAEPFGWKEALEVGGYTLHVTEGEEDAMATYTAFMREKKQKISVISLKNGSESAIKTLQPYVKSIVDKFKQVVFLRDMDEAGEKAIKDIRALFPADYPVKMATYTENDPNDMILAGKASELVNATYNAGVPLSAGIREFLSTDFEFIKQAPEMGISYPWEGLTEILRGIRKGLTIYIGAPEKSGKSTLVNEFASHLMLTHNEPIFAIKPEESEDGTLRRMAGAAIGKVFHDPRVSVNPDDVDRASALLAGKLFVLERNQTPRWEDCRQLMREAHLARGINYFFVDPITNFTAHLNSSETDAFLKRMSREVAEDAKSLGYTVFLFCHLKTPRDGLSWSEGRVAVAEDFAGSRAMVQACDIAIAMQAWKMTDGDEAAFFNNRRVLHIIAEREYNAIGKVELRWDGNRGKLIEVKNNEED